MLVNNNLRDIVPKQIIRPINNMSAHNVTLRYTSSIPRGKGSMSVLTYVVDRREIFDMNDAGSGPYTFKAVLASLTVTEVFFNSFEPKIFIYSHSVGLPIIPYNLLALSARVIMRGVKKLYSRIQCSLVL